MMIRINKMKKKRENFRNIVKTVGRILYTYCRNRIIHSIFDIKDILSDNFKKNAIKVGKIFYDEQILDENFDIYIFHVV